MEQPNVREPLARVRHGSGTTPPLRLLRRVLVGMLGAACPSYPSSTNSGQRLWAAAYYA